MCLVISLKGATIVSTGFKFVSDKYCTKGPGDDDEGFGINDDSEFDWQDDEFDYDDEDFEDDEDIYDGY